MTGTWREDELVPYRALIGSHEADMIMSGHIVNRTSDSDVPSSLSRVTLTGLLRNKLGFRGVIISDDMQMAAIIGSRTFENSVREAILAGNDILLFNNDKHPDPLVPEKVATYLVTETSRNPHARADQGGFSKHIAA